jgi:hypothetical protein
MQVVRAPSGGSPIIHIPAPRVVAPVKPRKSRGRRRGGSVGGGGEGIVPWVLTGAVVGMAEKSGIIDKLPEIPLLGRKGAAALALHFLGRGNPWMRRSALLLAAISAYEFGKTGSISGEDF